MKSCFCQASTDSMKPKVTAGLTKYCLKNDAKSIIKTGDQVSAKYQK